MQLRHNCRTERVAHFVATNGKSEDSNWTHIHCLKETVKNKTKKTKHQLAPNAKFTLGGRPRLEQLLSSVQASQPP